MLARTQLRYCPLPAVRDGEVFGQMRDRINQRNVQFVDTNRVVMHEVKLYKNRIIGDHITAYEDDFNHIAHRYRWLRPLRPNNAEYTVTNGDRCFGKDGCCPSFPSSESALQPASNAMVKHRLGRLLLLFFREATVEGFALLRHLQQQRRRGEMVTMA